MNLQALRRLCKPVMSVDGSGKCVRRPLPLLRRLCCRYDGWVTEMQGDQKLDVSGQPRGLDNLLYSADAGVFH